MITTGCDSSRIEVRCREQLRAAADYPVMLDHTGFVVSDLAKARRFYDAIAKALGLGTTDNGPRACLLGRGAQEPIP